MGRLERVGRRHARIARARNAGWRVSLSVMDPEEPKSRPEPPPGPSVYGGQWGESGKQNTEGTGQSDRPGKIDTPDEPQGSPDTSGPVDTHGEG